MPGTKNAAQPRFLTTFYGDAIERLAFGDGQPVTAQAQR